MGFERVIDAAFATFGQDATHRRKGRGEETIVRVLLSRPDVLTSLESLTVRRPTTMLDVRTADLEELEDGDTFDIGSERFIVQGRPVRDPERLVWRVDTRLAP